MDSKKLRFSVAVSEELKSYVYRLIDPRNGETFYVGKGKGNRVFDHVECLDSANFDKMNDKLKTIQDIKNAGLEVIHVIHRHGLSDEGARQVEAALIDAYPGTTNIAGGYGSADFGPMNAIEIINKYSAKEAVFKHNILMITINKSVSNGQDIYVATQAAWKLNKLKAEKAEFVMAVKQGIIVEVFKPHRWLEATQSNFPRLEEDIENRFGFIGEFADESIKEMYRFKRIPEEFRIKGAANPIKYNY